MGFNKIKKEITPIFLAHGFECIRNSSDYVVFQNSAQDIKITLDIARRGPPSLMGEFLRHLEAGEWKVPPPALRLNVSLGFKRWWYSVDADRFRIEMPERAAYFYTSKTELSAAAHKLTDYALNRIYPYAQAIVDHAVYVQKSDYETLFHQVQENAQEREAIPSACKDTIVRAQRYIESLAPKEIEKRDVMFPDCLSQIIRLSASLGNVIVKEYNCTWKWIDDRYIVELPAEFGSEFNSLEFVINHWNCGDIIAGSGLDSMLCRVLFHYNKT